MKADYFTPSARPVFGTIMNTKRHTVLMAVLLGLLGYFIWDTQMHQNPLRSARIAPDQSAYAHRSPAPAILPGANAIRGVHVEERNGTYVARVNYFYRGDFEPGILRVSPVVSKNSASTTNPQHFRPLQRGQHEVEILLRRDYVIGSPSTTRLLRVEMTQGRSGPVKIAKHFDQPLDWPGYEGYASAQRQPQDIAELYERAVAEIDHGARNSLEAGKQKLEKILNQDPRFVPAFPELARYHMKTNWGPEGLAQAERFLLSGLEIDPFHSNSHVLLGYVFAHQRRYDEAGAALEKAEELGTENLWLWANWGELLAMQGQFDAAIGKYEQAVANDRPYNTYDRARLNAYLRLIELQLAKKNLEAVDSLYRKRSDEYKRRYCFANDYAEFRLRWFGDADTAIAQAQKALDSPCRDKDTSRAILGAANYFNWRATRDTAPERAKIYRNKARLFFAEGPALLYWLAQSDQMVSVIGALAEDNVSVDATDNEGRTALAYALQNADQRAAERLIEVGANINYRIGEDRLPLLFIPVVNNDVALVKLLLDRDADPGITVYGSVSLLQFAEQIGHSRIAALLKQRINRT